VTRKSEIAGEVREDPAPVVLLDTVGELLAAYSSADIAFVGGSLVPKGGHNILEPALFGVPTITGTHMHNFREITEIFTRGEAVITPSPFAEVGRRARGLLESFRGATARNAALVARELSRRAGGAPC
jgi:3-deoxy-D-manno-octulosonic-acid transferase